MYKECSGDAIADALKHLQLQISMTFSMISMKNKRSDKHKFVNASSKSFIDT